MDSQKEATESMNRFEVPQKPPLHARMSLPPRTRALPANQTRKSEYPSVTHQSTSQVSDNDSNPLKDKTQKEQCENHTMKSNEGSIPTSVQLGLESVVLNEPTRPVSDVRMCVSPINPHGTKYLRGLQYLATVDKLLIRQKIEMLEAFIGFETNNRYVIKNELGEQVYYAVEDSDCCTRQCCGPLRPFDMKILNNCRREVIHLYRPLACEGCCFPCCLQTMEVSSPPGTVVGFVEQEWSLWKPRFVIKDAFGDVVLRIQGPCLLGTCMSGTFNVLSADGTTKVGTISKLLGGVARELFTDATKFDLCFPKDLDVKVKATLLGACFLIDFMYFEK